MLLKVKTEKSNILGTVEATHGNITLIAIKIIWHRENRFFGKLAAKELKRFEITLIDILVCFFCGHFL